MARLSKRKRKHPPDEKHQIGPFQFERYGRLTVQESHISELDMPEIRNHQINGYADTISEIEATSGTYDELQTHSEMEWNFVTGKRYINHCKLLFEQLLLPHNSIFLELFGISAAEFLAGIEKLRYSLMNRAFESLFEMEEIR